MSESRQTIPDFSEKKHPEPKNSRQKLFLCSRRFQRGCAGDSATGAASFRPVNRAQYDDNNDDNDNDTDEEPHFQVFPPVLALDFFRCGLKLVRPKLEGVRALIQVGQLVAALQDPIDIVLHHVDHLVDLLLGLLDFRVLIRDAAAAAALGASTARTAAPTTAFISFAVPHSLSRCDMRNA